ncbi:SAM domain-containing protein SAMSN-1b [Mugil cephalus]|uniref:SAM domain-containing protein SAMSN-1b n=1 Tax=Mugil cephalus TaxID=48193 RepID=UPI001FB785CC|nr:SAM domain-containing protein SAMSN-1b [Mugil cephalus]
MNLFCFTLDGSTESIYEPAYSQTLEEGHPQCSSALLSRKAEWGGSEPSISSHRPQSTVKLKRDSERSHVPTSVLDKEMLEKDNNHVCWMSSGNKSDLLHPKQVKKREKSPCQGSPKTREDRTQADPPAQAGETEAATVESTQTTGRLKKFQNLVQTKKGHEMGAGKEKTTSENNDDVTDVMSNSSLVLTCIGRGKKSEKKPSKGPLPQQPRQQQATNLHGDPEEDGAWNPSFGNHLWSPFDCPQPWSSFYHSCHQPRHELWPCEGTISLPRTTEWDRFESLIQKLDSRQSDLPAPQMIRSITDLHLSQNPLTRFGRFEAFRQHWMKSQDNGSCLPKQEQSGELAQSRQQRTETVTSTQSDRKHVKASHEETLAALINKDVQKDEADEREAVHEKPISKGRRPTSNSLESLYSLNSGQSSSSGVTSGSDCSSNRDSLRLEDDLSYSRQFCGRAQVHTGFVPSPYDTESLKLKVGDVIDIIAKPPMGIWTGMLNGRIGNFKFVYVDVLMEKSSESQGPEQVYEVRHKSTVEEVLKRLSLEEYSSSLQLNGYQTVDDLMRLSEHHLTKLNVTDPEHRQRLLAAVHSLQQLCSNSHLKNEAEASNEGTKATMNNCTRDSGCHIPSDSPDIGMEEE